MASLDPDVCYRALVARDARFDGLFFVGVKTTGIYCRPVCRARTPGRDRCLFFKTAAQAEEAGFRSCFRCRPELAPGAAPVDALSRVVAAAMRLIEEGALSHDGTIDDLARALGVSGRHLRRAMQAELGVSPIALAASRRLALARQLIVDTALPMTEVAFAAGYRSVRRFNAAVRARYARPPSAMRRTMRGGDDGGGAGETLTVTLHYRPPYDWPAMLSYFVARAMPGIELVRDGVYLRTAAVGARRGWLAVTADRRARGAAGDDLDVAVGRAAGGGRAAAAPVRSRRRPRRDRRAPGARSAAGGARARAARLARRRRVRRLRGRGAHRAGTADQRRGRADHRRAARRAAGRGDRDAASGADAAVPAGGRSSPRAAAADLAALGIPGRRAATLLAIARAVSRGELALDGAGDPARIVEQIVAMPGVGPWTAHYLAMRGLGWPDAFPEGDLGLRKALGGVSGREARAAAERWRPWRAYGATHLWNGGGSQP